MFPRFGASYRSTPFAFVMSLGLNITKSDVYSTLPFALTGASERSWMIAFFASFGSTSPVKVPVMRSYAPTVPKVPDTSSVLVTMNR
jgi:hypothetical protein